MQYKKLALRSRAGELYNPLKLPYGGMIRIR